MPTTSITAIEIYRLVKGKIAGQWVVVDDLGMLQQLGVVPMPGWSGGEAFIVSRSSPAF